MKTPQIIMKCLHDAHGAAKDNTRRAQRAFDGLSNQEMDMPYGHSKNTKREILDGYVDHEKEISKAIKWLVDIA